MRRQSCNVFYSLRDRDLYILGLALSSHCILSPLSLRCENHGQRPCRADVVLLSWLSAMKSRERGGEDRWGAFSGSLLRSLVASYYSDFMPESFCLIASTGRGAWRPDDSPRQTQQHCIGDSETQHCTEWPDTVGTVLSSAIESRATANLVKNGIDVVKATC